MSNGLTAIDVKPMDGWTSAHDVYFGMAGLKLAIAGEDKIYNAHAMAKASQIVLSILNHYKDILALVIVCDNGTIGDLVASYANLLDLRSETLVPTRDKWDARQIMNMAIARRCDAFIHIHRANYVSAPVIYNKGWARERAKSLGKLTQEYIITGDHIE